MLLEYEHQYFLDFFQSFTCLSVFFLKYREERKRKSIIAMRILYLLGTPSNSTTTTLAGSAFLSSYRGTASSHIGLNHTIAFFVWLAIDTIFFTCL